MKALGKGPGMKARGKGLGKTSKNLHSLKEILIIDLKISFGIFNKQKIWERNLSFLFCEEGLFCRVTSTIWKEIIRTQYTLQCLWNLLWRDSIQFAAHSIYIAGLKIHTSRRFCRFHIDAGYLSHFFPMDATHGLLGMVEREVFFSKSFRRRLAMTNEWNHVSAFRAQINRRYYRIYEIVDSPWGSMTTFQDFKDNLFAKGGLWLYLW